MGKQASAGRWSNGPPLILCMVAGAAVSATGPGLSAFAQTPAAKAPAAKTSAAKPPTGPGSIGGIWFNPRFKTYRDRVADEAQPQPPIIPAPADGKGPLMQPWAIALVQQRLKDAADGRPYAPLSSGCTPYGMPSMMFPPGQLPIQILESPGQVTVLFEEYSTFRVIRLNAKHPADPDPGFFGDSIGHWEGDTLVVDTVGVRPETPLGLSARTIVQGQIPHSDAMHIIERIRRTGPDTVQNAVTIDDPKTFTRPYTMVSDYKHFSDQGMEEFYCENNRNPADGTGHAGVTLSRTP